jgi:thioredoxin-related protein
MKKLIIILFFLPLFATAQDGMQFVHGLSWKEIQAKAKAENKYIFMDAWTTWCGPCIYMSKNIFVQPEVGNFFNKNFINVKMQLDTSRKDSEETKKMYQDAHDLMVKYDIKVFPTFLFFDPNGKIVHRVVGRSEADKFMARGKDALDPDKQYYVLLDQYKSRKNDPEFLKKLANASQEAYDQKNMALASNAYLATQKDLFTKDNLEFIDRFTSKVKDAGFPLMLNNIDKFNQLKGAGETEKKLVQILLQDEVYPRIFSKDAGTPDWVAISSNLNTKYRQFAQEVLSTAKVNYFMSKGDWVNFQVAVVDYMQNYGAAVPAHMLNEFAWAVFENCKDLSCVEKALDWSKRSFKDKEDPMYIDTYANLLYKLGKKDEAIEWQEKAIAMLPEDQKADYQETLNKMKKGEKTWKD